MISRFAFQNIYLRILELVSFVRDVFSFKELKHENRNNQEMRLNKQSFATNSLLKI